MLTQHEKQALQTFREEVVGWERANNIAEVSDRTLDALVTKGYLEEQREGFGTHNRWLRITEHGNRTLEDTH